MYKLVMLACIFSSLTLGLQISALEEIVVKLTPPAIAPETISEKIVCVRPMREGKFNISTENYSGVSGKKQLVNIYGHGGSGWTTLFGSVNKGIGLYEKLQPNKQTPIRIIGSGCMGLTTAIELKRQGYNVVGITTKDLYDITSWRAAGYFALVSVKTSPEEQEDLNQIGMHTYLAYKQIDEGKHPYITKSAVTYMPVYGSANTDMGLEDLEEMGVIPPHRDVTLDFGNGTTHPNFREFMTYFMNTTTIMRQLTAKVKELGIPVEIKNVISFDEISEPVVFNCTGLGGRELNSDDQMIAVRGHLIALNEQSGSEHMNYMIYTLVEQDGKEEYVYMFPKNVSVTPENKEGTPCRSVLGGTFIPNVDKMPLEEQQKLDVRQFQKMLDRNKTFFHGA